MTLILSLLGITVLLAYLSQWNTGVTLAENETLLKKPPVDIFCILLMGYLALFAGLRTSYNDTGNYIRIFNQSGTVTEFFADSSNTRLLHNPAFNLFVTLLHSVCPDSRVFIFITSVFVECCFVYALKHYSVDFTFTAYLFVTLGTFIFTLAAMKQVIAMAILLLGFPAAEKKNWLFYSLVVFVAMLFHTYAIIFLLLPFCGAKPWSWVTWLVGGILVFTLRNFQSVLSGFLDFAEDAGKVIAEYEIFDNQSVNILRVAVYAVPPVIALVFQKRLFRDSTHLENVFVNMSIFSLAFMIVGTESGANMFGRMATYFEVGTLLSLPWMLKKIFTPRSYRVLAGVACACYFGYFIYATYINNNFSEAYHRLPIFGWL